MLAKFQYITILFYQLLSIKTKRMNTAILFSRLSLFAMAMTAGAIRSDAQSVGQKSTPGQLVDALHTAFGDNHSRAVHAKGIILEGEFTPSTVASSITT